MDLLNIIIAPIITEKSMNDAGKGRFTFKVAMSSTKHMIKKAVEGKFKVNVLKVSTITVKGRTSRVGQRRNEVILASFKKAVVTLKEGQKIGLFEAGA